MLLCTHDSVIATICIGLLSKRAVSSSILGNNDRAFINPKLGSVGSFCKTVVDTSLGRHRIDIRLYKFRATRVLWFWTLGLNNFRGWFKIEIQQSKSLWFSVSLWRRANARSVRLYYPYWQYTDLFIFRIKTFNCPCIRLSSRQVTGAGARYLPNAYICFKIGMATWTTFSVALGKPKIFFTV